MTSRHAQILGRIGLAGILAIGAGGCSSTKPAQRVADDPRAAYEWSVERIEKGKCLNAQEALRLLSLENAGVTYIDSIVYQLARAYMCMGDYALAQVEYERVVNNYPSSQLVDDAAFGLAYAQFKQAPGNPGNDQSEAEQAVRTLEEFLAIYPLSDRRDEAEELLLEMKTRLARKTFDTGRLYLKLGADSAAMIYFQHVWDDYTESPYAARALWLLAERARKQEAWPLAMQRYQQLITVYPNSMEVKRARTMLKRIQDDQAKQLHDQADEEKRQGRLSEALELYEDILGQYPEYRRTDEVRRSAETIRKDLVAEGADSKP